MLFHSVVHMKSERNRFELLGVNYQLSVSESYKSNVRKEVGEGVSIDHPTSGILVA